MYYDKGKRESSDQPRIKLYKSIFFVSRNVKTCSQSFFCVDVSKEHGLKVITIYENRDEIYIMFPCFSAVYL